MTDIGATDIATEADLAAADRRRKLAADDEEWIVSPTTSLAKVKLARMVRAFRSPGVAVPSAVFAFIVFGCFLGPSLFGAPGPSSGFLGDTLLRLGAKGHILGTDNLGNDMMSRILHGGEVSIGVGLGVTAVGSVVGSTFGMIAGYLGGVVESVIMRIVDSLLAFPGLILALGIAAYLGPSETNTIWAISFFGLSLYSRLARSQTLNIRHRDYVTSARSNGVKARRIILRHVLPNIAPALMAYAMITVGTSMLLEASLSFLGLGIQPPQPSWGNMISAATPYLSSDPALILEPAICLFLTVLSLNLIADGLRRFFAEEG